MAANRQFLAFVLTGGFAALCNWLSRMVLSAYMSLEIAIVVAYLIGMTIAYTLSRIFVFQKSGRSVSDEYTRFALVNVVALVQVWLVTIGLADYLLPAIGWTWRPEDIAHAAGVASPVLTSYLGHRYFTFGPQAKKDV
ncbi:GtrA family protein [Henriciella mobilis]|uniref:GtrA family protein n=1 Tax=Henriciella mobilis TaxID=2305467 RepID=UPI001F4559D2|nr:GtrA family protein [Henriciella mobilis]